MTIGERTFFFNLGVIVFNIVLGLIIEGFLVFGCLFLLMGFSSEVQNSIPVGVVLPFILIIGFFACVAISRRCVTWVIDKFDLRDKLDQNLIKRYPKKL
ncbi:MAG: hypothetical protein K6B43_05665 [Treponema sp.]|nr:hypothetical protein [Treponema sp.]